MLIAREQRTLGRWRVVLKGIVLSFSVLAGAILGGYFPGSLVAFGVSVRTGLTDGPAETVCFVVNLLCACVGTAVAMLLGGKLTRVRVRRWHMFIAIAIGLLSGTVGYFVFDYQVSLAEPPL